MTITEQGFWALGAVACIIWAIVYIVHDVKLAIRLQELKVDKDSQVEWFANSSRLIFAIPMLLLLLLCVGNVLYLEKVIS